jgi:predicted DCC family thiol-disulfide oxidoreductase YuxK
MDDASTSTSATASGRAAVGRLALLYDGACELCRISIEGVRLFDNSNALDLLDVHDDYNRAQFPNLKIEHLMEELHVVDDRGRVWRGARAVNEVLRRQHGIRGILAWLWYVPGFSWLADRQYKRIAGSRYGRSSYAQATRPAHQD